MTVSRAEPEIVIAGAGLAGLTAAIALRRAGRHVRVLERDRTPGARRLPDWDAVENWTSPEDFPALLARMGIEANRFRAVGYERFTVLDPYGRRYDVCTPQPFFYLVRRGVDPGGLERGLLDQAAALDIPIERGVTGQRAAVDLWAAGRGGGRALFTSVGVTFVTEHADWVCVLVDRRVAPRAYAYLGICDGVGTLAVVLSERRHDARALLACAEATFRRHVEFEVRAPHKAGGSGGDLAAYWQGHTACMLGEAGGFQDFLWGFGIRQALISGHLAAQAILDGDAWQTVAEQRLRPLVRASLVNRWVYDQMPNPALALLVRHFARHPELHTLVRRWYHPRLLHRLLWPLLAPRLRSNNGAAPRLRS